MNYPELLTKANNEAYNQLLQSDIKEWIDKDKLKAYCDLSTFNFATKVYSLNSKMILAQIVGYANIAEPTLNNGDNNEDNLDVLEKTESKFLQGDDDISRKVEKVVYKLALTDGVNDFYAFEYEGSGGSEIQKIVHDDKVDEYKGKYRKVLIGPICEGRRGIFYLKGNNWKIAKEI